MYIVIEFQINGNQTANIVTTYESALEADAKFYQILSAAAVSSVEKHSAVILTDNMEVLNKRCYIHTEETGE